MDFPFLNLLPPYLAHDPLGLFLLVFLIVLTIAILVYLLWTMISR